MVYTQFTHAKKVVGNAPLVKLTLKEVDGTALSDESKQALKANLLYDKAGLPLSLTLSVVQRKINTAKQFFH